MARALSRMLAALALAMGGLLSCYRPDLSQQVFRCDRGKCPEGLFCNDNVHCTEQVPECAIGGIVVASNAVACIGAANPMDPKTICAGGATAAKCDSQMLTKELCSGIPLCAYCCK